MLERDWQWKFRGWSRAMAGTAGRSFAEGWRWIALLRPGGASPASGPGGFYVSLVVVALVFCHGAFGYAHQLSPVDVRTAHVAHAAVGQQPDGERDAGGLHMGDAAYFATLLALLFGALLLPGGGGSAVLQLPASGFAKVGHKVGELPPPRGPTLPLLQVLRL
ncbi:MAG: hypothetical protein AVDCRST_MAG22-1905 [uncultured Rubrobacteraceae bacterium]|uniref:Uncharacterized protein n=1 Tax=uncultured Rubrobacteraceae bacterium TaxID=349277 RepID=A0A6J4PFC6_9ACTN|nr:MAG: hypothetical protein AVDCRST_MAG22-1905 [uncultured Rubrobacteraceae bacterium]